MQNKKYKKLKREKQPPQSPKNWKANWTRIKNQKVIITGNKETLDYLAHMLRVGEEQINK